MALVLKVFLEDPGQPRYGFQLMKLTGMASGSLYPMLAKLEGGGLADQGQGRRRPARRWPPVPDALHYHRGRRQRRPRPARRSQRAVPATSAGPPPSAGQHSMTGWLLDRPRRARHASP